MWALWTGVGLGVALCLAGGIALRIAEENLPQRQQERLETVIGLVAVAFVSWMVLWMRAHARELKGDLEASAAAALATGSAWALDPDGVPRGAPRGLRDRRVPARDPELVDQRRRRR